MGGINKSRQQVPPDGASSLNPPRSPRFSDRYSSRGRPEDSALPAAVPVLNSSHDWFENKDAAESM